ncbi:hypothetical protein HGB45_24600 [Nocardia cerradoensis]|uniref:hypothetical protein n=1 Tax=Nocardia cerradoensis TaxID=85688 RepID=UPI0002F8C1A2|nr:hypothetical protein [Nocardia cerradoensis]NKY46557.1 hypothetical protein [Nocardia cerradoensis]
MSEDSTQLSVAELLARNGQGVPASGGGRRRRGGRGIAVTDLTGDLPAVREGSSSHAAPEAEPDPEPMPDFQLSVPGYEAESPLSGPISFYDPLAAAPEAPSAPNSWEQPGYEATGLPPASFESPGGYGSSPEFGAAPGYAAPGYAAPGYAAPGYDVQPDSTRHAAPEGSPAPYGVDSAPAPTGRRARRELREALAEREAAGSFAPPEAPVDSGRSGRRHRPEPDERNTVMVPPFRGGMGTDATPPTAAWAPPRPPETPSPHREFGAPAGREFGAPEYPTPGRADLPRRNGAKPGRDGADAPDGPAGGRNGADAGGGLPAWSARRRPGAPVSAPRDFDESGPGGHEDEPAEDRSPGWSLAAREQPLLSGQTVAGDLLRDAGAREERREAAARRDRGPRRGVIDLLDPAEARTEFYAPVELDEPEDDYDDDLLDDEEIEATPRRRRAAPRGFSLRDKLPQLSRPAPRRGSVEDLNRRQWMILGGQAVGAAVAGMLLFKGFEQMWDIMPFVALVLAMVVILGLVALVRVLRRTDDILSTVIAVVVGIFVTLGPLAFLLSTN